jgi:amino acid permease
MKRFHYKSYDNLIVDYCKSWNNKNNSFFFIRIDFWEILFIRFFNVKAYPNLQYVVSFISIENICDIFQYRTVICWQEPPVSALEKK